MRHALIGIILLTRASAAQPSDPAREAQHAQELVRAGKAEDAIPIYQDLLRRSPENAALLMNLCVAEYTAKRYPDAIAHASAALRIEPDLLPARLFLGASRLELGEFAAAIDALRQVAAANPRERNARLMLGEALLGNGQADAAVEHLRAAVEMLPRNPRVWYSLGRAYESLGRQADANEAWARLAALEPSLESHMHAAEVHTAAQRWREASAEWQEALRLAPAKLTVRIGLAEALFRARDYDASMSTLKPVLAGGNAEVQFLYGACLLNLQQPAEAVPYLNAAVARDSKLLPARAAMGQALLQEGKPAEAIPWLQSAIPGDRDGSVRFQLFRAYQLTHRDAEARQAMAEYQRFRSPAPGRP